MEITAQELKQRLKQGEQLHILDVREDWEYEEGHIEGARNFSVYRIPENSQQLNDWRDKEVIVHCKTGVRSRQAQSLLKEKGFENVVNLIGGYEAYKAT